MDDLLDQLAASTVDRDDGLRAYADQLILRGEPFGELIVVALERARRDRPELARREAELLALVQAEVYARIRELRPSTFRWRAGFLDSIRVELRLGAPLPALAMLANEPSARLLRRLEIHAMQVGAGLLEPMIAELVALAPRLPRLVELVIVERAPPDDEHYWSPLVEIEAAPLYAAYPKLELLQLAGGRIELGELALPELRVLAVNSITLGNIRSLVAAQVPKLERLELVCHLHRDNIDAVCGPLLYRDFPALKSLSIVVGENLDRWLATELPRTPIVRRLQRIALRLVDPNAYDALIANASELAHLTLELDEAASRSAYVRLVAAFRGRIKFT